MEEIDNLFGDLYDDNNDDIDDLFGDLYDKKENNIDVKKIIKESYGWKSKEINDWICEELQQWIISVGLDGKYEKIVVNTIGEQEINGQDFNSLEEISEIMDSFPDINSISGNKIFAALTDVRTKGSSQLQDNNNNIHNVINISLKDKNKVMKEKEEKQENEKEIALRKWLSEAVELPEYIALFIENGIDCIEVLKEINISDLNNIGIKKIGHRKRIILHINKLNETQKNNNCESSDIGMYKDEGIKHTDMKQSELTEMNLLNDNDMSSDTVQQLINMGFDKQSILYALKQCNNDIHSSIKYLTENNDNNINQMDESVTPYI